MTSTSGTFQTIKSKKRLPGKGDIPPRLRHRSRCSESDGGAVKEESAGDPLPETASFSDAATPGFSGMEPEPNGHHPSVSNQTASPKAKIKKERANGRYKSVFQLFCSELTRGYYLEGDESHYEERRERVYTFMATPRELEKFCIFGFLQCLDAFLFMVTFLPIRIIIAVLRLLTYPCAILCGSRSLAQHIPAKSGRSGRVLQPAQVCDLLKGVLAVMSCAVVNHIDTSMIYHLVRGQTVIKLYVFYNMLDLVDRVMSGFGQDILDTLYWTATEPTENREKGGRRRGGVLFHFTIAMIYIISHGFLIMCQVTVLNVAFNSHSKALLTILMSNNFVEIKGSLFRHVDRNNLQQISCSDVKERFHYASLLLVVFVVNMAEFNWNPDQVWVILPDITLVLMVELFVDWTKHAFITKFNQINPETYRSFLVNLAQDMVTSRQKHAFTDYSDQVCRRLGFTPLPLLCLLVRTYSKSIPMVGYISYILLAIFYCCLVSLKLLTSIILLGVGCRLLEQEQESGRQTDPCEIDSQVIAKKAKKDSNSEMGSPRKDSPIKINRSVATRNFDCASVETSVNSVLTVGHGVGENSEWEKSWIVRSVSDSVVKQQCHSSLNPIAHAATSTVNSASGCMHKGVKDLNSAPQLREQDAPSISGFEDAESESDSHAEFHNSVEENDIDFVAPRPVTPNMQAVDFDEEKKYK